MSTPIATPGVTVDPGPRVAPRAVAAWAVAASCLLVGSGALRAIQAERHQEEKGYKVRAPFPLAELPRVVGTWHFVEGSDSRLDDLTTRITGSTDHVLWRYKDDQTGTTISSLVLYGPAEPVVPHTPQVCYPATGYREVGGATDREIRFGDGRVASFRSDAFIKPGGRDVIRALVYHSFRLDGLWSPGIANRRFPRKNPGIFKVQIQRRVIEGEGGGESTEPIEQFLAAFLSALERQIVEARPAVAAADPGR